jgi:hypothetical protein
MHPVDTPVGLVDHLARRRLRYALPPSFRGLTRLADTSSGFGYERPADRLRGRHAGLVGWNLIVSLPAILLVAWLAGRLLGVSRGWAATVVAGLVGWLAALALSLAIAEGDPRAPGFGRNLWVFAIVFTTSAAV